jgi:hypothetical protein
MVAGGCGSDDATIKEERTDMTTSADIIRIFRQRTGDELLRAQASGSNPVSRLSFSRVETRPDGTARLVYVPPEMESKYGNFTITVFPDRALRDARLQGKDAAEDGVYWHREDAERGPAPSWIAQRPYGENVLLTWVAEESIRKTTAQWDRLRYALDPLAS